MADLSAFSLPQVFHPGEAARILRGLGLMDITECALRTRAYRKQVPFHLNGRRIMFTFDDLREIAEGEACRPRPPVLAPAPVPTLRPSMRRRPLPQHDVTADDRWRARGPNCPPRTRTASGQCAAGRPARPAGLLRRQQPAVADTQLARPARTTRRTHGE
ncbi:MAG: hypothetical protein ACRDRJ_42880 [Streptosporangiaceae bacterium]